MNSPHFQTHPIDCCYIYVYPFIFRAIKHSCLVAPFFGKHCKVIIFSSYILADIFGIYIYIVYIYIRYIRYNISFSNHISWNRLNRRFFPTQLFQVIQRHGQPLWHRHAAAWRRAALGAGVKRWRWMLTALGMAGKSSEP